MRTDSERRCEDERNAARRERDDAQQIACGWAFDAGMREAERDGAVARADRAERIEHDFAATPWPQAAEERVDLRDQRDALALALNESKAELSAAVAAEREQAAVLLSEALPWVSRLSLRDRICDFIESGAAAPREG